MIATAKMNIAKPYPKSSHAINTINGSSSAPFEYLTEIEIVVAIPANISEQNFQTGERCLLI